MSLSQALPPAEPDPELLSLFESTRRIPKAIRRMAEFYVFFARTIFPQLETYRSVLQPLYCADNGRPACDPVRLLGVLVLQFIQRMPDRQAAEAVQYDLRWRLALHLSALENSFDPSLLSQFRTRILEGGQERVVFEAVLEHLVAEGWIPKRCKQRLDSTHICGLLSAMSRLECVRETIRLALEDLEYQGQLPQEWAPLWNGYVETKIDPRSSVEALKAKVRQAGQDTHVILVWADAQPAPIKSMDSLELLRRVFQANYELDDCGNFQQTRAQPAGAVQNPHEPEAKWSSKSTIKDKTWVGYKVQVAETVQDQPRTTGEPTCNFITAMVTQEAPQSDKAGMAEVFAEQAQMGLELPSDIYVDGAYVCSQALKDAQDQGRELHGPAPAPPDRGKVFTVEAFDVQLEQRVAVCPSGQSNSQCSRLEEAQTGKVAYRIEWNNTLCGDCPLKKQCLNENQTHRTIVVGELHSLLQQRRRFMLTDMFILEMRRRNGIEATQSEQVRAFGLRRARYRGKAKVRLQNYLIGAACNIRRLFRRIQWEASQTQPPSLPTTVAAC